MAEIRLRRIAAGDYITTDERFRVVRGWGDETRLWVLLRYNDKGDADILEDCARLRDARASIAVREGVEHG